MCRIFILICFCFASSFGLRAQELRQGYLDSVKGFLSSKSLIDWIQKAEFGNRIIHPSILIHPSDSTFTVEDANKLFKNNKYSTIYHWETKVSQGNGITYQHKTDSLILTMEEKQEILNISLNLNAGKFEWTTDYFPGAVIVPARFIKDIWQFASNVKEHPNGVYFISLPVFLRNHSIGIFSYTWLTGGGGSSGYKVYQFNPSGGWQYYGEFAGGDF